MTTIYWIRHAEAEGNLYRRCQGNYNSRVTENGKKQLEALAERFSEIRIDAVYSSDLFRAWLTADSLARPRGLTVGVSRELREINLGNWEDKTWGELARDYPKQYNYFVREPWKFRTRGAETVAQARIRAVAALRAIAARHETEGSHTIAIVSHGAVTRAAMTHIQQMPPERMAEVPHGDNTSVSLLTYDGGLFDLKFYADNSHLGELSTLGSQQWWRKDGSDFDAEMWFRPVNVRREAKLFEGFRRDAWRAIYGNLENYNGDAFIEEAKYLIGKDKKSVVFAMSGERPVGLLELEVESPIVYGAGHIGFFYLVPELRGKGLGVQLLGQAVSVCRAEGDRELTLRVFEGNAPARKFYEKHGFSQFGDEPAFNGRLIHYAMDIDIPTLRPAFPWR
ncbi:hypothetical protein FACS1894202_12140 [Clostridia bacterium]|nr:hypothetical protein FACS1894202_12140 [Clostridia bacterium]